jgi:hypothetical protein
MSRRRRPSAPLAILAGVVLGLALAGALRLFVVLALAGLGLAAAAVIASAGALSAELRRLRRPQVTRVKVPRPPGVTPFPDLDYNHQPAGPAPAPSAPAPEADPGAALRATLRARADQVSSRVPAPGEAPEARP